MLCIQIVTLDVYKSISRQKSLGCESKVGKVGKVGVEGKNYVVKDGDVMHFLFNL
ncbi:MAG: DUF933 domain-containing protein [Psychroserpens sp.]